MVDFYNDFNIFVTNFQCGRTKQHCSYRKITLNAIYIDLIAVFHITQLIIIFAVTIEFKKIVTYLKSRLHPILISKNVECG